MGTQLQKEDIWLDHFRVYQGDFIEDDLSRPKAVEPTGKLATTWGELKAFR